MVRRLERRRLDPYPRRSTNKVLVAPLDSETSDVCSAASVASSFPVCHKYNS